jgi:methylated-DNA-protein-cysteine methyltransferase-like protein
MDGKFIRNVYGVVAQIPAGKVLRYGDVAAMCGNPKAVWAVGNAMKHNPDKSVIPCHRVVGSDGSLHGYAFGGIQNKRELLLSEGVEFSGEKVALAQYLWERS